MVTQLIDSNRSIGDTQLIMSSSIDCEENTLTMEIKLPPNYPDTALSKHLQKQKEPLASLDLSIEEIDDHHVLFLDMFFVNTYDTALTEEESKGTRGLGKIMLCEAVRQLIKYDEGKLLPEFDKIEIHLEAMAGLCKPTDREALLARSLKPEKYKSLNDRQLDQVCAIEKAKRLCRYYTETYGFQTSDITNPLSIYMKGFVRDLLRACSGA